MGDSDARRSEGDARSRVHAHEEAPPGSAEAELARGREGGLGVSVRNEGWPVSVRSLL